jgi:hypothetical protein
VRVGSQGWPHRGQWVLRLEGGAAGVASRNWPLIGGRIRCSEQNPRRSEHLACLGPVVLQLPTAAGRRIRSPIRCRPVRRSPAECTSCGSKKIGMGYPRITARSRLR